MIGVIGGWSGWMPSEWSSLQEHGPANSHDNIHMKRGRQDHKQSQAQQQQEEEGEGRKTRRRERACSFTFRWCP